MSIIASGSRHARCARPRPQRGQAALLVVMVVGIAATLLIYGMVDTTSAALRRDQDTAETLAQAKQALIGYAASDLNRPGSLPCPDTDNNGAAQAFSGSDCPGYIAASNVYVGRLPWRTLGLPDLRDGSGERLWYAVSRTFAMNPSCIPSCPPAVNSDTLGQLAVTGTAAASDVIAVVFAPGGVINTQVRNAANENTLTNYLEDENATNNNSTFTTGPVSTTFNDRLLVITNADLMPVVEQRVGRELLTILQNYKSRTGCCTNFGGTAGCYPWADLSDGESDAHPPNPGSERNRGRIPVNIAAPYNWGTNPCGAGALPTIPAWFLNNDWHAVVYYSAGRNFLGSPVTGDPCNTCVDSTLSVDGVAGKEVVILMPGPLLGTPPRSPVPMDDLTYWSYYFDIEIPDENRDNSNDLFVTPSSKAYTRDRIFTIP